MHADAAMDMEKLFGVYGGVIDVFIAIIIVAIIIIIIVINCYSW